MESEILENKRKHQVFFLFFIVFIAIIGFIIYTSFSNNSFNLTGNVISEQSDIKQTSNIVKITADLTPPKSLNLKSTAEKISFKVVTPVTFNLGTQKIELQPKNSIILDNFDGGISFSSKSITELNGKATKIYIDGVPITPAPNSKIKINSNFEYSYLKLNNIQISSLNYKTEGEVNLYNDKIQIKLNNENINIKNFQGDLEISKRLKLSGYIPKSNVKDFLELNLNEQAELKPS